MRSPDHASPTISTPSPQPTSLGGSETSPQANAALKIDERSPITILALKNQSVPRLQGHRSLPSSPQYEPSYPAVGIDRQHTDHLDVKLLDELVERSSKLSTLGKKTSNLELFGINLGSANGNCTPSSDASSVTSRTSRITQSSPDGELLRSSALRRIEERKRVAVARTGPLFDETLYKWSASRGKSPVVAAKIVPSNPTSLSSDVSRPRIIGRPGPCSRDMSVPSTPTPTVNLSDTLFPFDSDNSDTDLEFIEPNLRTFKGPPPESPSEVSARFAISKNSPKDPQNATLPPSLQQLVGAHDELVTPRKIASVADTVADSPPPSNEIGSEVKVVAAGTAENVSTTNTTNTTETCTIESTPISVAMEEECHGLLMRAYGGMITKDISSEDVVPSVTKAEVSTTRKIQEPQVLRMSSIKTVICTAPFTELEAQIFSETPTATPTAATTDDTAALLLIFCFTTIGALMVAMDNFTSQYSTKLLTNMGFAMFLAITICIAMRIHTGTLKKENIKHIPENIARWVGRETGRLARAAREGFEGEYNVSRM